MKSRCTPPVSYRVAFTRGTAALLAVLSVVQIRPAHASPADIFQSPAPVIGSDPPKATDLKDGDSSVSTQTGAFQYSYPIVVPPGRNGMGPSLALSYSSQAPLYGGIAAGWSLSIPEIREDTSHGRMRTHYPIDEIAQGANAPADDRFVSSLAGGRPLIAVTEPTSAGVYKTYRAQNDASFARYERLNPGTGPRWRVLTTDGTTLLFGESTLVGPCSGLVGDGYAPLTSVTDAFGNQVLYNYEQAVDGECRIANITWGQNANAGITQSFAKVEFGWTTSTCNGQYPGSQISYTMGKKLVTGASKLATVTVTAFPMGGSPEHTRLITLSYSATDEACNVFHAPLRLLTSIQESAWGNDSPRVDLPATTFDYGPATNTLVTPGPGHSYGTPWVDTSGPHRFAHPDNLGWGYRRNDDRGPSVEAMMLDLDGDGLLDRMVNYSIDASGNIASCQGQWQRNLGPDPLTGHPQFSGYETIAFPRLKWGGPTYTAAGAAHADRGYPNYEGCSLNGQVTAFRNSPLGTGVLTGGPYGYCHTAGNPACTVGGDPTEPSTYCPGGQECPGVQTSVVRTSLAYRWLDMDADGLVDLVAAVHGNIQRYDIDHGYGLDEFGNPLLPEPHFWGSSPADWPACPSPVDRCKDVGTCISTAIDCSGFPCSINWNTVSSCVASAPTVSCNALIQQNGPRQPYTRCEGLFPWFIYKNQGNGVLASAPIIKYSPVPLESDTGDSAFGGRGISSTNYAVTDFDGDGFLDAVLRAGTGAQAYYVWLGDGTGGFGTKRYTFVTRPAPGNKISEVGGTWGLASESTQGLVDLNGDGLPDHWKLESQGNANINLNATSNSDFLAGGVLTPYLSGTYAVKPGNDATLNVTKPVGVVPNQPIEEGTSMAKTRLVDLDVDGRPDVVQFSPTGGPIAFFNLGGNFNAPGVAFDAFADNAGMLRTATASPSGETGPDALMWELSSDLMDLDGDGIAEGVYWGSSGFVRANRSYANPPRLMISVANARGAQTNVTYAGMHDKDSTVEQDPSLTWSDGRPKAMPRTQWVVKSLSVVDTVAGTTSTTSYSYSNPRHGADDQGRYAFRGFEEVTTTAPCGATTVQRYGYDPDWSGRLIATLVVPAEAPTEVRSIDKTTWEERTLFGGLLKTFHPIVTERLVCANGQDETTCTPSAAAAYTRTTSTLTELASTMPGAASTTLLWQETSSLLQAGTVAADGDRQTATTYALHADEDVYLLRPLTTTGQHRVSGVMTMFSKTAKTWDTDYLVPLTDEVWVDSVDANRAITRRVFDMDTGNVLEHWKPKQNAASTTKTTYTYDSRELFVIKETNEVGHEFDYGYEYGTGTKLFTAGPNVAPCSLNVPPNCPSGTEPKQKGMIRIDGLGRTIERWDTFSEEGTTFNFYLVEKNSYNDTSFATSSTPTSVTHEQAYKLTSSGTMLWRMDKSELDGLGRPIQTTLYANGSAPLDAITTFQYTNAGTLGSVTVPDPSVNNASTVSYTYTFDSLGRPIGIRRPDAAPGSNQSGVNISYDGVTTTTSEYVGGAGGLPAVTRTLNDDFGRLIQVDEQLESSPASWATTLYSYGPDNNVQQITDPEMNVTALTHDFAGNRTAITRGSRTWNYTYDKNGNVIAELVPGWTSALDQPNFTTTTSYDDLDRSVSRSIGQRNLSVADQALFGAGTETFIWDYGPNRVGRLRYWRTFAPGAGTEMININLANNSQGQRTTTTQTGSIAGFPSITRQFQQRYYVDGQLFSSAYLDQVGGNNRTASEVRLDAAGRPNSVFVTRTGEPNATIAVQTRNVAGLVTNRKTTTSGAMTFVESNWTYDKLGRVTSQVVQKGPGPTQVVRQDLAYFGNDDPSTLTHYLGASSKTFAFGYDPRHQLTSANETTTTGYFESSYYYGDAGRFVTATIEQTSTPAGSEVRPREVTYQYGGADPEQITALINAGPVDTGLPYASYTYDGAGNQTSRCYGTVTTPTCAGELTEYVYDGKDQLRRATKKLNGVVQGSEEYWYDGSGQRMAIVKRDNLGTKTEMIWFNGDTQAHYDSTGALTHVYSHLSLGTPVARVDRTANTTTAIEYQFHGLASNTIAAVDHGGTINASFSYAPFGEVIEATNAGGAGAGTAAHRRRMNDKYEDDVSTLSYYGARYYDKTLIAWTQTDPISRFAPDAAWKSPRRSGLYVMSLNNTLRYIDPDGRQATLALPAGATPVAQGVTAATLIEEAIALGPTVLIAVGAAVAITSQIEPDRAQDLGCSAAGHGCVDLYESYKQWRKEGAGDPPPDIDSPPDSPGVGSRTATAADESYGGPVARPAPNTAKPDIKRGPGGAKKHTPGHRPKHIKQQNKKKANERNAKVKAAKEARQRELRAEWNGLTDEQRKLHGDSYERWSKEKLKEKQ
ncbi:MAG: toxin TcdB middle/N-terminal domain-containing protein [Kofleriaceae bacterium]